MHPSELSRRRFLQSSAVAGAITAATGPAIGSENAKAVAIVSGKTEITLNVNGESRRVAVEPRTTLLDALRERIGLTGTKVGCNHGQCGACTVIVDGQRTLSCLTLAMSTQKLKVRTIEGIADRATLHPLQAAFIEHDGFQCGYCTPGQVCSGVALIDEIKAGYPSAVTKDVRKPVTVNEALSNEEIRERMSGNLCRCAAYNGIAAVLRDAIGSQLGIAPER